MIKKSHKLAGLATILAASLFTVDAWAGGAGTITYGPVAQSVPILSQTMLMVLGFLLAVVAYRVLQSSAGGKPLAIIAAVAITGSTMVSGSKVVQDAYAVWVGNMTSTSGGVVNVSPSGEVPIHNTSGATLQILNVTGVTGCFSCTAVTATAPQCSIGTVVPNGSACNVNFSCTNNC